MSNYVSTANREQHPIRVAVVDDHPVVRRGIVHELASHADIAVIGEADNGDSAYDLVQQLALDVVALDITMPGRPVTEVMQQVAARARPPYVMILTAHWDLDHILTMLKAGATGYVLKDEDPATITTAVRTVARGEKWISPTVTAKLVDYTVRQATAPAEPVLSMRELQVLEQLTEGKENLQIGSALCISERTVRFHLRNIYDKLGVRRGEAIARGVRMGFGQYGSEDDDTGD